MIKGEVSIIIPTLQARAFLSRLLPALLKQTYRPKEIIIVDSESRDGTAEVAANFGCTVEVISRCSFNHGGTRNLGAWLAKGDLLVFMTQDALPADNRFLSHVTRPILEGSVVAAYARQIPYPDAPTPEVFNRKFNYPSISDVRTLEDLPQRGIKTFFFSNVASAVRRDAFESVGRFPENVIMNEDVILCAKLLHAGYSIGYNAEAQVYHSHTYTLSQQFRRYFDIGVATLQARDYLHGAKVGGEGVRFAYQQMRYLLRMKAWSSIPRSAVEIISKHLGFQLGIHHELLPTLVKRKMSMHSFYWSYRHEDPATSTNCIKKR